MADTIEVKYKADLSDIIKGTDTYEKKLKSVETTSQTTFKKVEDNTKKASQGISDAANQAEKSLGSIDSALKGIAAGVAAAFSVQKIIAFTEESFKAFAKSEAQTQKLRFALDNITKDGGSFDRLVKQSEDLQNSLKIFDAEDIQSIQAAQAQFGLTANQIEKLTPLVLELATAQGVDLATATDTALKAIEGQTRGLKTVGAAFTDTGNSTDNFNLLTENLAKLQGSAADALNTTNGQLKSQEVAMENLQETIGARIAPALLALKQGALEAADALTTLFFPPNARTTLEDNIERVKSVLNVDKNASVASLRQELSEIPAKLKAIQEEGRNLPFDFDRGDKLEALRLKFAALKETEIALKEIILERGAEEKRAAAEATRNADIQTLSQENLLKLSKKELQAEIATLKARGDNTKEFQDQVERREKALEEIVSAEKKAGEKLAAQREADAEKAKTEREKDFEQAFLQRQKELDDFAKLEEKRQAENLPNIVKAIDNDTTAAINALKAQYLAVGDFSVTAQKELQDKIEAAKLDGLRLQLEETRLAGGSTVEIEAKINDALIKGNEDKNKQLLADDKAAKEKRIALLNEVFQAVGDITERTFAIFEQDIQNRQDALREQTDRELQVFDDKQTELDRLKERGAISDREYQRRNIELTEKRTAAEKKAANEQKKLQAEAARTAKELAIFEIILNTARGITAALAGPVPNPFLAASIGVAGALELAVAVNTPIPKFFKGVKKVDGKEGIDQVPAYLTKGERVVTVEKNKKNWEYYEAIDNNNLEQLIFRKHVVPVLEEYKKKAEADYKKRTNEEVGKVIVANFAGLTGREAERIARKGVTINNLDELKEILSDSTTPKYYGTWKR